MFSSSRLLFATQDKPHIPESLLRHHMSVHMVYYYWYFFQYFVCIVVNKLLFLITHTVSNPQTGEVRVQLYTRDLYFHPATNPVPRLRSTHRTTGWYHYSLESEGITVYSTNKFARTLEEGTENDGESGTLRDEGGSGRSY